MSMRERLQALVDSRQFEALITLVIVINAIALGLETLPDLMARHGALLVFLDRLAIAIFVVELLLRLMAHRLAFFHSGWNLFDLAVVSVALVPASGPFSVLRALRILRALRLVSVVPSMRKVVQGLFSAIPSLGTVVLLLLLVFYVGAVMTTELFGAAFPAWFGTIGASLYTLFQIMTLESWSMGIVRPVMAEFAFAWMFFVPFILLTSFIVLNLFIAVIVNAMHEGADAEAGGEREEILRELRELRGEIGRLREVCSAGQRPR